jgi:hypothetical protein
MLLRCESLEPRSKCEELALSICRRIYPCVGPFPGEQYKHKLGPADDEMVIARQPLRSSIRLAS